MNRLVAIITGTTAAFLALGVVVGGALAQQKQQGSFSTPADNTKYTEKTETFELAAQGRALRGLTRLTQRGDPQIASQPGFRAVLRRVGGGRGSGVSGGPAGGRPVAVAGDRRVCDHRPPAIPC